MKLEEMYSVHILCYWDSLINIVLLMKNDIYVEWSALHVYSMNLSQDRTVCTKGRQHGRGNILGQDDSCDSTLAINMNYLSMTFW